MKHTDLSPTAKAYLECALWSSHDNSDDSGGEPLDANYDLGDCSPELLKQAQDDCDAFMGEVAVILENDSDIEIDHEQFGHDFWLSRNGHGAGFFDRGNAPVWRELQGAAKVWGAVDLYVGDDGQIYGN